MAWAVVVTHPADRVTPARERSILFTLAAVQFVNVLDFMMVMPGLLAVALMSLTPVACIVLERRLGRLPAPVLAPAVDHPG